MFKLWCEHGINPHKNRTKIKQPSFMNEVYNFPCIIYCFDFSHHTVSGKVQGLSPMFMICGFYCYQHYPWVFVLHHLMFHSLITDCVERGTRSQRIWLGSPMFPLVKTNNNYWFLTSNNNHKNYNNYWFLTSKSTIIIIVDLLFLARIFFICVLLYLKNTCVEMLHDCHISKSQMRS